jgi:hypothetical protein
VNLEEIHVHPARDEHPGRAVHIHAAGAAGATGATFRLIQNLA